VAIKLLAADPARAERLAARLRAERQILAALDHPGIAKLLDGGALPDGSPFLVMEYVEGERIDRFCDRHALDTRARLRLLLGVCDAVESAHRRLIVHRDLKPGNILVNPAGEVKLLDFGIAKLLDPASFDWTVAATEHGVAPLTLLYASPEQVRGEPIGTASDVYSLGVVLYELLTGRSPYAGRVRTVHELSRAICDLDPPSPSSPRTERDDDRTVDGWSSSPDGIAEDVAAPPPARLDRDLDAIVLKALRKDPAERYPTVAALADDLHRYLDGHPVLARRGDRLYRAGKFARRHRWALAAGAAFVLLLAGWAVSLARQLERTRLERDRAERVRDLFIETFAASDPTTQQGEAVTAREILDRATPRLESELADQPAILAPLLEASGRIYLRLGLLERAEELLGRSLGLRRAAPGPGELRSALAALAGLRVRQARYDEAIALLDEALANAEADAAGEGERADLLAARGESLRRLGRFDEARAALERALRLRQALSPHGGVDVAETHRAIALLCDEAGDDARAEAEARIALEELRRLAAPPARIAEAAQDLATVINDPSRSDEMEALNREALTLERRAFGDRHPKVSETLNNLAVIAHYRSQHGEASRLIGEALDIQREALGEDHPDVASMRLNLATFELADGRPADALATVSVVLDTLARFPDSQPMRLAAARRVRALARWRLGDTAAAVADIEASLAAVAELPADHPFRLATRARRLQLLRDAGVAGDFEGELAELISLQREKLPERHRDRVPALAELAAILLDRGRPETAAPLAEEAATVAATELDPGSPDAAWARVVAARVLAARGGDAAARDELAAAREALAGSFAPGHPRLRRVDTPR